MSENTPQSDTKTYDVRYGHRVLPADTLAGRATGAQNPAETEHPVGQEQAQRNTQQEPPG